MPEVTTLTKPAGCSGCPMEHIGRGFLPIQIGSGPSLLVGEHPTDEDLNRGHPFSGGAGVWLRNMIEKTGQKWREMSITNSICCSPPGGIYPTDPKAASYGLSVTEGRQAVEHCRTAHLWPAITRAKKEKIYAIGNPALNSLTGRSGIHTWRGSLLPLRGDNRSRVIPTLHPAALMRQAKLTSVCVRDLRKPLRLPPENYNLFPHPEDVKRFRSRVFAFDFEWNAQGEITLCGLSDRFFGALVVPFTGVYIDLLREIFERATTLIGHNITGADLKWIERMGWRLRPDVRIEDTMLKQHLIQPDYPHGLDFVASVFTSKVFWKGKGWEEMDEQGEGEETPGQQWRTWDLPSALPRSLGGYGGCMSAQEAFALYNARDTDAEFQINTPIDRMVEDFGLRPLYENVSLPAAYICRWMGDRGLRLDTTKFASICEEIDQKVEVFEGLLPEGLAPYTEEVGCNLPAPPGTYHPKTKICKGSRREPHAPENLIFTSPETSLPCPVCEKIWESGGLQEAKILKSTRWERVVPYNSPPRVAAYVERCGLKEVIDRKTGNRTTGKRARGVWAKDHPEFTLLGELKQQRTLRTNFAKDSLLSQERMYFNLKVHGTSEGRLSSSGQRRGIDLNIQNQPPMFRTVYIPDQDGWGFVNGDLVQGENWLTTWLAKDWERWERIQQKGYCEHSDLASRVFNRVITKEMAKADPAVDALRQIGKKINHGRNYGMGIRKQLEELISQGYDHFTYADVKEFIEIWKKMNARTAVWQQETIETAERQGFLRNPFGRCRWFSSKAIATEALAFLPASTLADCVLRMMIAHYPGQFQREIDANQTGVYHPICPEWHMTIQVHDSIVLQGPWNLHEEQEERTEQIMTQPFPQLDGFRFRADFKSSPVSWGDCH